MADLFISLCDSPTRGVNNTLQQDHVIISINQAPRPACLRAGQLTTSEACSLSLSSVSILWASKAMVCRSQFDQTGSSLSLPACLSSCPEQLFSRHGSHHISIPGEQTAHGNASRPRRSSPASGSGYRQAWSACLQLRCLRLPICCMGLAQPAFLQNRR